jgi:protein phosphatase PTC7
VTAPLVASPSLEDALNNAGAAAKAAPAAAPAAPAGMRLAMGACCLPHPDKQHYGGEDAFFTSSAGGGAMGVADGVGGWAESGVNPAQYSRTLMRVACAYIEGAEGEELARAAAEGATAPTADSSLRGAHAGAPGGGEGGYAYAFGGGGAAGGGAAAPGRAYADPRAALDAAHRRTRCPGSATAVVMQLDSGKRRLVAANLVGGDGERARRGRGWALVAAAQGLCGVSLRV